MLAMGAGVPGPPSQSANAIMMMTTAKNADEINKKCFIKYFFDLILII
jgi:hypothetical protein